MTTFGIIFFIVLAIGLWIFFYHISDGDGEYSFFSTLVSSVIILLIFCVIGLVNLTTEKSKTFGVSYISSLSLNSSTEGSFFMGCGKIEDVNYYYYLSESDLGYKVAKLEITDKVYIREDCNKKPYIEFTKYTPVKLNWFASLFFKKSMYNMDGEIIIHAPKNTVIKRYNVDISNL